MKISKLDNGLTIISQENECSETIVFSYLINVGSFNEDESNLGIAHFTEHMLFKGTKNRTALKINEDIENIGGILNAETSYQYTKYWCQVPADQYEIGIDVLSDLIFNNTILEDEFNKEKQVILEELKMYDDDIQFKSYELLSNIMNKEINKKYVGGTLKSVNNIERDQMLQFIDKYYTPNNIYLVATGKVNHKLIEDFLNKNYNIEIKNSYNSIKKQTVNPESNDNTQYLNCSQANISFGIIGPSPNEKDYYAFEIINDILGGKTTSRLYKTIREQEGLAYSVSTYIENFKDYSMIIGYMGLDNENTLFAEDILKNTLENLNINDEEIHNAKTHICGFIKMKLESSNFKNNHICDHIIYNIPLNINEYLKNINDVTLLDIKNVINKYFNLDNLYLAKILPTETANDYNY